MDPIRQLAVAVRGLAERIRALESRTFLETDDVGALLTRALSVDPADPPSGSAVLWLSDGTGSGDAGDVMVKITSGGTTKTTTLINFSSL